MKRHKQPQKQQEHNENQYKLGWKLERERSVKDKTTNATRTTISCGVEDSIYTKSHEISNN